MNTVQNLYASARKAYNQAYAPYSKFRVGAAVLSDCNRITLGCNVENISYPCGTCAEAGAIATMIADGGKRIKEILIIADSQELIRPCGACLQRIAEFATPDTIIHLADLTSVKQSCKLTDLLPQVFGAEELIK